MRTTRSALLTAFVAVVALAAASAAVSGTPQAPDGGAPLPGRLEKSPVPAAVKPGATPLPLTADQSVLEEIRQRGYRDALALAAGLQGLPAGAAREALEKRIVEIKIRTRVEFLHALSAQQRARGRLSEALVTDAIAEQLLHPATVTVPGDPQGLDRARGVK